MFLTFEGETIKQLEAIIERAMAKSLADAGVGNGHSGLAMSVTERQKQAIQRTLEVGDKAVGLLSVLKQYQPSFLLSTILAELRREFGL